MSSTKSNPYVVLISLWMMVFSSSSQVMIMSPILTTIGEALVIPEELRGTLITSYVLVMGICALFMGPISDKIGRRIVLLFGTGAMSISLLLHAFAFDYWSMLALRALAGASGGLLSGAAVAYVGDYFPYEKRGWANGWVMSGIAVGQVLGIPIGIVLADNFGFRSPFLMFAIPMAVAFALIWFQVPQPEVKRDEDELGLVNMGRRYLALIKDRAVVGAIGVYFLMFFSMLIFIVYLPTWLENDIGFNANEIATMFLVGGVASVIFGPQAGKISDRLGRKPLIIASGIGMAIVMTATTFLVVNIWSAYVVFFVSMVLLVMRVSPLQALLTALVPAEKRGSLMSLTVGIGQVGSGLGSGLAGLFYIRWGYFSNTLLAAIGVLAMATLVWKMLPEPKRREAVITSPVPVPVESPGSMME